LKELASITELRCYNPAINAGIFPDTPAAHFWSATGFSHQPNRGWLVEFYSGEAHTDIRGRLAKVRPVRDAKENSNN
jgi:hypothetical protein